MEVVALGVAAVVGVVLGFREGPGYGLLTFFVALVVVEGASWLPIGVLVVARWISGTWHPVILGLGAFVVGWFPGRVVLMVAARRLVDIYRQEESLSRTRREETDLPRLDDTLRAALSDAASRSGPDRPVSTAQLLVALIRADVGVRWGALAGLNESLESEESGSALRWDLGERTVALSQPAAKAMRLMAHLAREYGQQPSAALAAVATILVGGSSHRLLLAAGISTTEALEIVQGDPLGGELQELEVAHERFELAEHDAHRAMVAESAKPTMRAPWRPRLVNLVALLGTAVVMHAAAGAVAEVPDRLRDRETLASAIADLGAGRRDEALAAFAAVSLEYPDSTAALLGMACPLFDIGYQDQAMLVYAGLLSAGFPFEDGEEGCFVLRPVDFGIRIAWLGSAVRPYVADSNDATEAELLRLLERAAAHVSSRWQAELLLACLNHRHDLRLLAATNLQAAELAYLIAEDDGGAERTVDIPRQCLDIADHYRVVEGDDGPMPLPRDASERFYAPGRSQVPRPGEPPLREVNGDS